MENDTEPLMSCDSLPQRAAHVGCECDEIKSNKLYSDSAHIYIMTDVDSLPQFPQGEYAKGMFIKNNRKLPLIRSRNNTIVQIEFIVEKDGSLTSIRVIHSINKVYDDDALAIIHKMPRWKPAIIHGYHVRCKMKILIPYREHSLGT